ncbi:glycoside hydrolase family 2 protein [Puniceicoccus vermicola]|uniref:Glycoside hydrolase family 2 protein n=1 Tax=Puniceicoccus vermicola TaxID=388746 RepID=A0A7X1E5J3_9BACT|nr:glycoside hydrolase family 2 protein [Puniceicoccus vermicola]
MRSLSGDTWCFTCGDPKDAAEPTVDDTGWSTVRVPHDWAIAGPFDSQNDAQHTIIHADGEKQARLHLGRTGGLPHQGVGWYRLPLDIPAAWSSRRVRVIFDGVMSHSIVYCNGREVGSWPYGYTSFQFDLTPFLLPGGQNLLAVRVANPSNASRWYPGAGIYRNVLLEAVDPAHIAPWGVAITTPDVQDAFATVVVRTEVTTDRAVTLQTVIRDPSGYEVASDVVPVPASTKADQTLTVANPERWNLDRPALYTLRSRICDNEQVVDEVVTRFGIRALKFTPNGFWLNDRPVRFQGVCMHHDLGLLGAAVHRRAVERQVDILQEMGCNAIRTSHNPPAPELLEYCDEKGILVLDEAFDEWRVPKVANGYSNLFDAWAEKDLRAMIRRDRNHPCVVMWSIGNEILDQGRPEGRETCRWLTAICHDEDSTRPVTAGFNDPDGAIQNGLAGELDIPGWNYRPARYAEFREAYPDWIMYGSETESCVSTRGEYVFPAKILRDHERSSGHCSAYELESPCWGYPPDIEFAAQEDRPYMLGEFVWTGFDYLGEPTPYKFHWPSRSSYFGIVDLCGFPKDRYYLYRSQWRPEVPTLHLLPHWSWPGREGEHIPVHVFTNAAGAELFLNGQSLGIRRKDASDPLRRFRLVWDAVTYAPGELRVRALDTQDHPTGEEAVQRTAGASARLTLSADRIELVANGDDLSFLTIRMCDTDGIVCPSAAQPVVVSVQGPAEVLAVDGGDPTSLEPIPGCHGRLFHGMALAVIRTRANVPGEIFVTVESSGFVNTSAQLRSF